MCTPPSALETVLLRGDAPFLLDFFRYWDPSTIFLLGSLNYRLLNVVRFYEMTVWDIPKFLSGWFFHPSEALKLLEIGPAIFCGSAVLKFLDRNLEDASRLDICVGYAGIVEVGKFLASEGYVFRPEPRGIVRDFDLITMLEAVYFSEEHLKVDGDRSLTQEAHGSRAFRFVRFGRRTIRVVVVHLVRCELHRFVFSMHSSEYSIFNLRVLSG